MHKKSKQYLFMGYGHKKFGYKLWDPVDKKIIRSRDVIFLEDQTIEDLTKLRSRNPIIEVAMILCLSLPIELLLMGEIYR
jgi:hypothetical protein